MELLKSINTGLAFLLELAMLAAFGYWGFHTHQGGLTKWVLGIGIPLVSIVVWGLYFAPNSTNRLNSTAGVALSAILFLIAAAALYFAGARELAIVFAVLVVINRILLLVWQQW